MEQAFAVTGTTGQFDVKANVFGGGITGQVEAIRLAISKALVELNQENHAALKPIGLLSRDPRKVERKKYGQKKARKKYQFSKR
jgi:small subunit ribosomal protein S9